MKFFKNVIVIYLGIMMLLIEIKLHECRNFLTFYQKVNSVLIKPCIFEKLNPVIVSNDLKDIIAGSLWTDEIIPTILIDPNFEISNDSGMFLPKLPTYILSTNKLQIVVQIIKFTSWWNINSHFFIVSENCDDAWSSLQTMWKMNLLSSVFVCNDVDDSFALYTFNPYANFAPKPWQHVKTVIDSSSRQWTLFKRFESTSYYDCNNLFFEKTNFLNGYEMIVGAMIRLPEPTEPGKAYNASSMEKRMTLFVSKSWEEIFNILNVTPIIYYTDVHNPDKIDNQITRDEFFHNLTESTFEIILNFLSIMNISNTYDFIYPQYTGIYAILTRRNKVPISSDQISSIFSINVIILTGLLFVITLIVLLFCKKTSIGSGLLEILRLILSSSTLIKFYRDSLRVFIASVLIFVIIMNANYQSKMSAYSTKIYREKINTIADLKKFQYSIYMTHYIGEIFGVNDWTERQKVYVHFRENHCDEFIKYRMSDHTACMTTGRISLPIAMKYNLHTRIIKSHHQFITPFVQKDWPLKPRVDVIISRLSESGLLYFWEHIEVDEPFKKLKRSGVKAYDTYREIVIEDLYYIFFFLAVCLATSFIFFIVEICTHRLRSCTK